MRRLVASLFTTEGLFNMRPIHVGFVVDKVGMGQVISEYFGFLLSISFHQCLTFIHSASYHRRHKILTIESVLKQQT